MREFYGTFSRKDWITVAALVLIGLPIVWIMLVGLIAVFG